MLKRTLLARAKVPKPIIAPSASIHHFSRNNSRPCPTLHGKERNIRFISSHLGRTDPPSLSEPGVTTPETKEPASVGNVSKPVETASRAVEGETSSLPSSSTFGFLELLPAWKDLPVSPAVLERLAASFPHITTPTPAQRLFLLSVLSGNEVYLKDGMGRGKTLSISLAALQLALDAQAKSKKAGSGPSIILVVPSPHLAHQICDHLTKLCPPLKSPNDPLPFALITPEITPKGESTPLRQLPDFPIVVGTAKAFYQYNLETPALTHVFLDEPDTMVGPIPSRFAKSIHTQPLIRHPPPIVHVVTSLLRIGIDRDGQLDFSERRNGVNMVMTSATIQKDFKRFCKTRGWIRRGNAVVDLDFSLGASEQRRAFRERLLAVIGSPPGTDPIAAARAEQHQPEHHVLLIDGVTGDLVPLDPSGPPAGLNPLPASSQRQNTLPSYMVESLALLHSTSPPPPGKYVLALPPQEISLPELGRELASLGIPTSILTPEALQVGIPSFPSDILPPIFLAARSSVPGLHLQDLWNIYLLNGLDIGSLTPSQRKNKGEVERVVFYDTAAGRLGRLGTDSTAGTEGERQKVVSLVMAGGQEETWLSRLFSGELEREVSENSQKEKTDKKRMLKQWDMEVLNAAVEHELGTL
ncbi:hypothetical protein L198_07504 [Cryptococcus wingfieldii CBS 7118]|uniref:ATP-dependent RNA helicase n=1 Tax=Cryptococcus wingfieldii CBS 7118 TaxID=1295528 RepID=A0A1E3IB75_9TREE|nr:hypothetical protein L198_07504 [Cryptococcus wingfieldii CBS 7118]ODN85675.1 hypothetical protein L198_07504 [Cryptococcus wingfieldii CBS 7118]